MGEVLEDLGQGPLQSRLLRVGFRGPLTGEEGRCLFRADTLLHRDTEAEYEHYQAYWKKTLAIVREGLKDSTHPAERQTGQRPQPHTRRLFSANERVLLGFNTSFVDVDAASSRDVSVPLLGVVLGLGGRALNVRLYTAAAIDGQTGKPGTPVPMLPSSLERVTGNLLKRLETYYNAGCDLYTRRTSMKRGAQPPPPECVEEEPEEGADMSP